MAEFATFTRSEMQSVPDLLAADHGKVPWPLLEQSPSRLGAADVSNDVFTSKEIHDLEVETVWKKTWQWACRTEEIPAVGDHVLYDVANLSAIVVRVRPGNGPGAIRAFHNVCLHRGTKLRVTDGNVPKFRCPFHGWTWNLDGTHDWSPCDWDFPELIAHPENFALPELLVDTWQGFVMVNFDRDGESLRDYLENVYEHFEAFPIEDWVISLHVEKVMPANWKVTMEAFMEAYHTVVTHPEILAYTGDANSQYDIYGRHNRMITPFAVASPHLGGTGYDQVKVLAAMKAFRRSKDEPVIESGSTARRQAVGDLRANLERAFGVDLSDQSDTMIMGAVQYFVFPNFMPWATYGTPLQYRFRPNGSDPDSCLMTLMLLRPWSGERPAPAVRHRIGIDEKWADAPGMRTLGVVYDQDASNLARVQEGLKSSPKPTITLGEYQESRLRHFHAVLDRYLGGHAGPMA
jgi:phenylpropionate dioxygenase-like ring-hydroxylating dioxygenase large terminal subunit